MSMLFVLVLTPALAGLAAFAVRPDGPRRVLLIATAIAHVLLTMAVWVWPPAPAAGGWLLLDAPGLLFLAIASVLFLAASVYAIGYLPRARHGADDEDELDSRFSPTPEAVFTGCLLLFLAAMTLVTVSGHFGLLWVAVEASTLASAPLIYYHRHQRSLEATWKYLMICSVGVALALLANFFLAVAAGPGASGDSMLFSVLRQNAGALQTSWLRAAFILFLVGYGTKMGLAPLHYWLPDAHSESPSLVSALLSGALLNCAFLGILRALQVCQAAGLQSFASPLLIGFGLVSMAFAAVFILGQADYKRMLAYSSVEHMGILALGVGLGGQAVFGAMLHAVNHSLTKGMLFFVAGNILSVYRTKSTRDVQGVLRVLPVSGLLWVAGFLAISGSPPFGLFLSKFTILRAATAQGHTPVAVLMLALLAMIFTGMASLMLRMAQGTQTGNLNTPVEESPCRVWPPAVLALAVLVLGVWVPAPLEQLLQAASVALGGQS